MDELAREYHDTHDPELVEEIQRDSGKVIGVKSGKVIGVKSLSLTLGVMSGSIPIFLSCVRYLLISRAITARK